MFALQHVLGCWSLELGGWRCLCKMWNLHNTWIAESVKSGTRLISLGPLERFFWGMYCDVVLAGTYGFCWSSLLQVHVGFATCFAPLWSGAGGGSCLCKMWKMWNRHDGWIWAPVKPGTHLNSLGLLERFFWMQYDVVLAGAHGFF